MGQEVTSVHGISYEFFDSIGKHLPLSEIGKINAEAKKATEVALPDTSGTSYHLAIAIGYKLAMVNNK
jgi:hypothetical protein